MKHAELLVEYTQLIRKLKSKNISFVELPKIVDSLSQRYLCSKDWITFHGNGGVVVYPMSTLKRQQERSDLVFDILEEKKYVISDVFDFTEAEEEGFFLEGAGSVVLDRVNNVAYASISKLTDEELFIEFCEELECTPVVFNSELSEGTEIAHTSSILTCAKDFVIIGSGLIKDKKERKLVTLQLKKSGRELIYISESQVNCHVAEIKQVINSSGASIIVLSKSVLENLTDAQRTTLEKYGELLVIDYNKTEKWGAYSIGSVLNDIF